MFYAGEGNFLKKVFLPPHPYPSKTLMKVIGVFFVGVNAYNTYHNRRAHFLKNSAKNFPQESFWRYLFSKKVAKPLTLTNYL